MRVPCITEPCLKLVFEATRELLREPLDALALATLAAPLLLGRRRSTRHRRALACTAALAALALHQCAQGRFERWIATSRFPHASCQALGILELKHVPAFGPAVTITSKDNQSWIQGHRRWPDCEWSRT